MTHRDRESDVVERVARAIEAVWLTPTPHGESDFDKLARAAMREILMVMTDKAKNLPDEHKPYVEMFLEDFSTSLSPQEEKK